MVVTTESNTLSCASSLSLSISSVVTPNKKLARVPPALNNPRVCLGEGLVNRVVDKDRAAWLSNCSRGTLRSSLRSDTSRV